MIHSGYSLYLYYAVKYTWIIWTLFVIQQIAFGVFLWFRREDGWYWGCIPFVNIFKKRELGGINLALCIFTCIFSIAALTSLQPTPICIALILTVIVNKKFAQVYLNYCNPWVYCLVPFGKYVSYNKEVEACK